MASLNATDANMPVALESFDECANNSNEENHQMATDDNEKASVENDENLAANDTLIDALDDNRNDHNAGHKTIEHIKGLIASDQASSERSQQHQSPEQYNEPIHDNTNANALQTHPTTENSPNNPLREHDDNIIDRVTTENDVNELDKIFCDKNANSATSDNDDSQSIPGIENSDIADDITNDNRKDSSSLQTSNTANANASLDSNVFSDVDHQQHQEQQQQNQHQHQHQPQSTIHPNAEQQMHQYDEQMYQYNQQTQMSHEQNMPSHQLPQQHQMDMQIHRDNDPHYQYKLYSPMYLPPVNGNAQQSHQQHQQQQQQQQQQMQNAPFKPYQLVDSPATPPSTKNSNISSAPGTPSSLDQQRQVPQQQQTDDPYNFVDEDMHSISPHQNHHHMPNMGSFGLALQQMRSNVGNAMGYPSLNNPMNNGNESMQNMKNVMMPSLHSPMDTQTSMISEITPKKRGRKKKVRTEDGQNIPLGIPNDPGMVPTKPIPKERKKHDRFNGMSEEEVSKRTLPDHLANNLDIIIIGINPGLFAAYRGHHYAGPGNHFWKCLYLSGLTHEQMNAEEDYKLLDYGIGFTNMVQRATKGSADLTRKEIKEGSHLLHEKLRRYRPKIAVFNGKLIFEVFSGKKEFNFGRQSECVEGTNTYMWVMPSSSARCAQLPRAADKVPFYVALKKFRDYLNGVIPHIDESECVFPDPKNTKQIYDNDGNKVEKLSRFTPNPNSMGMPMPEMMQQHQQSDMTDISMIGGKCEGDMMGAPKKKRGRPKKVRGEGEENVKISVPRRSQNTSQEAELLSDGTPKKKRGRPKKVKIDGMDGSIVSTKLPANSANIESIINETALDSDRTMYSPALNQSQSQQGQPSKSQQSQKQSQQSQQPMNMFSPMSGNTALNMNGTMQCTMNGNFNSMQQTSFQSHEHPQQTNASDSPQQFSHSNLSSEISAAISTAEHLNATAGNGDTNSPSSNSQSVAPADFDTPDCVHNDNWNDHNTFNVAQQQSQSQQHHWQPKPQASIGVNAQNSQYLSVDTQKSASVNVDAQKSPYVGVDSSQQQQQQQQQHLSQLHLQHQQQLHLQQQQQQQQHIQSQHNPFQSHHIQQQSHSDEMSAYIGKQAHSMSDVTAKSLSGLESLVDQIPSLSDNHDSSGQQSSGHSLRSSESRLDIPSMVGSGGGGGGGGGIDHLQSSPFQNSCLYSSNYLSSASSPSLGSPMLANSSDLRCNSNRSRSSDINGASTPTANLMSHYSSSSYPASALPPAPTSGLHSPNSPQTQTPPINLNNLNNHPFSVSNLTGNHNYSLTPPPSTPSASMPMNSINSMNSYHSNFMAAAMQQPLYIHDFYEKTHPPIPPEFFQKTTRQATSNVDPHLPPFYASHAAAAYGQHAGFPSAGYGFPTTNDFFEKTTNLQHVQPQSQAFAASSPPTIHMPSPNYPYGYGEHHRRQNYIASDLFFSNHHGMFDPR